MQHGEGKRGICSFRGILVFAFPDIVFPARVCCVCSYGRRCARTFGGDEWPDERDGEKLAGERIAEPCAVLAVVALALAVGLTACDLCSYNARGIDMREERGKAVYIVSGDCF